MGVFPRQNVLSSVVCEGGPQSVTTARYSLGQRELSVGGVGNQGLGICMHQSERERFFGARPFSSPPSHALVFYGLREATFFLACVLKGKQLLAKWT